MTWRERIAEARERERFTPEDFVAWTNAKTCFVGEMRERYGLRFNLGMTGLDDTPDYSSHVLQRRIGHAISFNDFNEAERLLDYVEDRALTLKREHTA